MMLATIVTLFLLPVAWLIATAYKPAAAMFTSPPTFLFVPTLDNFRKIGTLYDLPSLVRSSLTISIGSALLSLLIGAPCGYALARSRSRWALAIAYLFLGIRTVPAVATLLPFYLLMRDVGLLGTTAAVILIDTVLNCAFVTWMMFSYVRALPPELNEAALTDGCTLWGAFWRVDLPCVRSGLVAGALFSILFSWNDFLYASFLTRLDSKPLAVALVTAYGTYDISWGTLGALAHVALIPIVLMVVALNRFFIGGLVRGVH
ncbi:carbohydrate ABC transporter permease [Lichenifustis flavocetrariae]|uniref:Carbohydrate ABC transporter permease n=1 Tax=Lichenifustis flavocetrariae TaxID=2949735 RepID=A0AA41YSY4_9HYPH|nr:carbohydrate ABC transporter permease [Lichenifustis flavocetrariae]MCW6506442.1 carbohydrate ABC transporter permease [Lichenifustis flavocetrariae]